MHIKTSIIGKKTILKLASKFKFDFMIKFDIYS